MKDQLRKFQKDFIKAVENPAYDTVCLSGPRGLGKTFLAGHILARCMTPGDVLHRPGKEYILGAASLEQARMTYGFIKDALQDNPEYRWIEFSKSIPESRRETYANRQRPLQMQRPFSLSRFRASESVRSAGKQGTPTYKKALTVGGHYNRT